MAVSEHVWANNRMLGWRRPIDLAANEWFSRPILQDQVSWLCSIQTKTAHQLLQYGCAQSLGISSSILGRPPDEPEQGPHLGTFRRMIMNLDKRTDPAGHPSGQPLIPPERLVVEDHRFRLLPHPCRYPSHYPGHVWIKRADPDPLSDDPQWCRKNCRRTGGGCSVAHEKAQGRSIDIDRGDLGAKPDRAGIKSFLERFGDRARPTNQSGYPVLRGKRLRDHLRSESIQHGLAKFKLRERPDREVIHPSLNMWLPSRPDPCWPGVETDALGARLRNRANPSTGPPRSFEDQDLLSGALQTQGGGQPRDTSPDDNTFRHLLYPAFR
ncbi:hypothetical protein R3X27_16395 [Tropicimonas sp. TH_r6]|nr:hypothetical protein [Tropicimonas sp. TH_r6]MDV7144266.1 hypothetical protein [Tropicimonas sp. TH_r6]